MRHATADDIPRLVEMGRKFHAKAGVAAPFSAQASAAFLGRLLNAPEAVVIASDAGAIGGMLSPAYCSDAWTMAVELFWWAEDRNGLRLLSAFEDWARASGANEIRMTTIAGLEPAERILARRGYGAKEISHVRIL